ncbi:MAG: FAD-dependent thymidylate synthase, partial [Actinobacteria bacterium]|nr:FAD-dependent thymidylate synthase [Actinomycetota bacterium]
MHLTLLQHTPHPDRAVAVAGRLCYAPVSAAELDREMTDADVAKLVRVLVRSGHHSALEHAVFTFAIDGVSRACTHQLVRHRVASYNQQSQRYVRFGGADSFIVPPSIAANAEAHEVFLGAMEQARAAYDRLVDIGLRDGRKKESVQEDARFVLPNATETKIVVTMNARELRHFFRVRC